MEVSEDRLVAERRNVAFRARARLHEACGAMGLFASAVWAIAVLHESPDSAHRARWLSLVNVVGFGAVVFGGRALRRGHAASFALDCFATVAVLAILSVWSGLCGDASAWLTSLSPALIVAHWASGGPRMGVVAWLSASLLYAILVLYLGRAVSIGSLAVLGTFAAAAVLGRELDRNARRWRWHARRDRLRMPVLGETIAAKYRLVHLIGEGGMGRVYEAERVRDGACVAVKMLHEHLAQEPDFVARLRRETEIASRLSPGRIPRIFELGTAAPGIEYIAMERLRGEDLSARLQREKCLSCEDTLLLVEQVAGVLDAAALAGVVHRDVQPRNIFLVESDAGAVDTRLLDFGMCRLSTTKPDMAGTRSTTVMGTPGFLAPEQVSDCMGELGPQTDVFALACVAYLGFSGRRAFEASDPAASVYEVLNHVPPPVRSLVPELPEAVDWVLSLALAKRPADRYRTAGEFARDLRKAATGALSTSVSRRAVVLANAYHQQTETLST